MAISITTKQPENFGSQSGAVGTFTLDSSYPTGGYSVTPGVFSLSSINSLSATTSSGYLLVYNYSTQKLMAFTSAGGGAGTTGATSGGTPAGTNGTSAVTGTGTFVGTSSGALELATPAFSGTGFATAGQVVTTTDNQTMGLNECAGMWFIADALASTAPVLIVSNIAVTGAPAALTVIGTAPATDAGTYKIVKNIIPTGSVTALSGTAAAQIFTGSALAGHTHTVSASGGGFTEVTAATNLSSVVANYIVVGQ